MRYANDPDGTRLPIKIDTTSNGEFTPVPLAPEHHHANRLAREAAEANAQRLGLSRRGFLVSACGAATTLLAMNTAYAAVGKRGGFFQLAGEASLDADAAAASVNGNEFIFDVQGHFVNPTGTWTRRLPEGATPLSSFETEFCAAAELPGNLDRLQCFGPDAFLRDIFMDSDTSLMVLSFVPSTREGEPLTIEEAAATAAIVEGMKGTHRMFLHGRVNPNQPGDLEDMERLAREFGISAWKTYTQWGPDGASGFWMDDDVGLAMIERARALDVKNIAIHKGLPFGRRSYEHSTCADVGRVAKRFPDVNFLIYHSGFVTDQAEGPYDPQRSDGVDSLITSVLEAGLGPGSNVYAELGSTWRFLMRDPDSAAHTMGKLLKHLGPDNILWGTDSIWYGSPQDQIQAFRTFQISDEFQERYGYPAITPEIRAKIFGLNALGIYPVEESVLREHLPGDAIARARAEYRQRPDPSFLTYGPKTRREFLNFKAWGG
ncbi:amidohydrolase family protein [Alkalisalibacterium limincola]|uniref:Amidohydrolase family protein n=1 Tax=Alkalisalibacterium limincola TaxID=2699169 RepID=A0A5C8L199_9GAMM|nr:amidohydrolase family protein [Alkalisalibacterium limincola]TXK66015.1 amidohydrolase family protein [Alkalisalibacterium limincola]